MTTSTRLHHLLLSALVVVSVLAAGLHLVAAASLAMAFALVDVPDGLQVVGGAASTPVARLAFPVALAVLALGAGMLGVVRESAVLRGVALAVSLAVLVWFVVSTQVLVEPM